MKQEFTWGQKLLSEWLGSLMLTYVIIASGILAFHWLEASVPLSVFIIAIATGLWLFVIVEIFGPISGAHVNPMVTIATLVTGDIDRKTFAYYIPVQIIGGLCGMLLAHLTFLHEGIALVSISENVRPDWCYLAEFWGSFALASTVFGCVRSKSIFTGLAVGSVVAGGIIAMSATMFVNPQVTIARIFTGTITGVRPYDAIWFLVAECVGGAAAGSFWNYLRPRGLSNKSKSKQKF